MTDIMPRMSQSVHTGTGTGTGGEVGGDGKTSTLSSVPGQNDAGTLHVKALVGTVVTPGVRSRSDGFGKP